MSSVDNWVTEIDKYEFTQVKEKMKIIKLLGIIIIFSTFQMQKGKSTTCLFYPIETQVERSDLIFIGRPNFKYNSKANTYNFRIGKVFKNTKNLNNKNVKILTGDNVWGCGANVWLFKKQLVFARWNENEEYYYIYTGDNLPITHFIYSKYHEERLEKSEQILGYSRQIMLRWDLGMVCLFFMVAMLIRKVKNKW